MSRKSLLPLGCLLVGLVAADGMAADSTSKKLIEFGWDEPSTGFLRQHLAQMEQTPFDGCVFHVDFKRADGSKASFTWDSWSTNAVSKTDLQQAIENLKAVRSSRFRHNFLRFNTRRAIPEWGVNNRVDMKEQHGGLDNEYFIEQMHRFIMDPINNVAFHCYFDVQAPDGHHQLSPGASGTQKTEFPLAAARFKDLFGARPPANAAPRPQAAP